MGYYKVVSRNITACHVIEAGIRESINKVYQYDRLSQEKITNKCRVPQRSKHGKLNHAPKIAPLSPY